jgi:hypothetical protein
MSYSNRVFFYGPVVLLLLVIVLYSVFWRVQADTLAARLDRANGGEIIPGVVFAFAEKSMSGFPFRLDVVLSGVTFSHPTPEGETAWRSEKLALHRQAYDQKRFIFEADGLQSFAFPPVMPGTVPRVFFLTPGIARASAILTEGKLVRFDLDLWQVQEREATLGADPNRRVVADRAQLHLLVRTDNTVDVAMQVNNARIGAALASTKSELALSLIEMRGKLTHGEAFDALRSAGISIADAANAWRGASGTLSVSDLTVDWSGLHASLRGDLTLDEAGLPTGRLEPQNTAAGSFGLEFRNGQIRLASASAASAPAGAAVP